MSDRNTLDPEVLARIRGVLTGEAKTFGVYAWLREETLRRTGWLPGKATISRYAHGKRASVSQVGSAVRSLPGPPSQYGRIVAVVDELADEAREKLREEARNL